MRTYLVQVGDYMKKIADQQGVPLYALLRANPQIPDKNKIYPGEIVNIPDTIGPPPLPQKKPPAPAANNPDAPFAPWIIPPSLDPQIGQGVIQEVYLRYRTFEQDTELGDPFFQIITPAVPYNAWRLVSTQVADVSNPGNPESVRYADRGGGPLSVSTADNVAGIRFQGSWVVVEYRYFPFQSREPAPASIPKDGPTFAAAYGSGFPKDPPPESGGS